METSTVQRWNGLKESRIEQKHLEVITNKGIIKTRIKRKDTNGEFEINWANRKLQHGRSAI